MENKIKTFIKKPIEIKALEWTGLNENQVINFCLGKAFFGQVSDGKVTCFRMTIETIEGLRLAQIGDWIIKGIDDEFYPCKRSVFEKTYQEYTEA
jgi:hypothetical protein